MSKLAAELWQLARFSDPLSNFESRVEGSTNEIGYNSLLINIFLKKYQSIYELCQISKQEIGKR